MKYRKPIILFTLFAMNLVDQPTPQVTIEQGILSGIVSVDGSFFEYLGIPYGTTDSSTRFQAPLPPPKWEGVFKAVDDIYQCPQIGITGTVVGVEDCLKINVYVPVQAKKPLPVMVYIHGGAFLLGNGGKNMAGPDFLVKHDVILVTFNYRLGALGFTCLNIKEAPGNAGLKDQVAALRWVHKNIRAFGGDPDNVTLFGVSAGGTSTSLMVASDATVGLFNKAIIQSGSSIANWAINRNPLTVAKFIAKSLGYDAEDPQELYEIFSKVPYKDLIVATANKPIQQVWVSQLLHLPCVEKDFPGVERIVKDLPYNIITNNPKNISLMYTITNKEGIFFIGAENEESLANTNKMNLVFDDLVFPSKEEEKTIAQRVRERYFGKDDITNENILNLAQLNGDLLFEMPLMMESEIMTRIMDAPVYNLYFTYSGARNLVKQHMKGSPYANTTGAFHGDDIAYVFKTIFMPFRINEKDQQIIDWLTSMLTNFAKYGDPTPNGLPIKWIPNSKDTMNFLNVGDELTMGPIPQPETFKFWKEIYGKYRCTKIN